MPIRLYYPTATADIEKDLSTTYGKVAYHHRLIKTLTFCLLVLVFIRNKIFLFKIYYNLSRILYNVYNIKII